MKPRSAKELMYDNLVVKHYAGSIAYGTNLPSSDVDFRGIFCADPVNVRTPFFPIREANDSSEEDTKLYEASHFCTLCADNNPNIVETLWVDEEDITDSTEAYQILRDNREVFLSSKIGFTTTGYAMSQLKRIKGHNKWINNPQPVDPPKQTDFVSLVQWFGNDKRFKIDITEFYDNHRLIPYGGNIFGLVQADRFSPFNGTTFSLNTLFEGERHEAGFPIAVVKYNKDEYELAKDIHNNYWTWKENRNKKRSELEEQFGYDTKHAMHLVRLLRMGYEALDQGKIIVKRPDAAELLAIRNGSQTYEELVNYADYMDEMVKERYKTTSLQKTANTKAIAKILMDVQESVWYSK